MDKQEKENLERMISVLKKIKVSYIESALSSCLLSAPWLQLALHR